jgi:hypothetical protein
LSVDLWNLPFDFLRCSIFGSRASTTSSRLAAELSRAIFQESFWSIAHSPAHHSDEASLKPLDDEIENEMQNLQISKTLHQGTFSYSMATRV